MNQQQKNNAELEAILDQVKASLENGSSEDVTAEADRDAAEGSVSSLRLSVVLHNFYMNIAQWNREWEDLAKHAKVVREHCSQLLQMHDKGAISLDPDDLSRFQEYHRTGLYYAAMACAQMEDGDLQEGIRLLLLQEPTGIRERLLLACLQMEAGTFDEDHAALLAALKDEQYTAARKSRAEDSIYGTMAIVAASDLQKAGDPAQAVALLEHCKGGIACKTASHLLSEELARYTRDESGTWHYHS